MRILAGRYRLTRPIGRGGMAQVWRADDLVLRRTVAVKMLSPAVIADGVPPEAIRREAQSAAQLSHPHIAAVYDYGEASDDDGRHPFIVMEFVAGPTLAARIGQDGPLDWRTAVRLCAQVAGALDAAHGAGVVHRDVKPGNVMLAPTGAKVVDFGVATAAGQQPADPAGRIWGTPAYLPPEQLRRGDALPAGDVYALGLLLFECLAGSPPWQLGGVDDILARRRRNPVPELPRSSHLPAGVVQLYRRCLAAVPADRPSAAEAAAVLDRAPGRRPAVRRGVPDTSGVPEAVAPTRPHRTRAFTRRAVVAVTASAAAAGLLAVQLPGSGSPRDVAQAEVPAEEPQERAGACAAEYLSRRDGDGSFTARLAMTNTGARTLRDWTLQFDVPDGQQVTDVTAGDWEQRHGRVRIAGMPSLAPGATATVSVAGDVGRATDQGPAGFAIDGEECGRSITRIGSAAATVPAQPTRPRRESRTTDAVRPHTARSGQPARSTSRSAPSATTRPSLSAPAPTAPAPEPSRSPTGSGPTGSGPTGSEVPSRPTRTSVPESGTPATSGPPAGPSTSATATPSTRISGTTSDPPQSATPSEDGRRD
ncbi:protein kinase domain-containing protein [Actinoplanes sp. NPDC049316]|uniref:serine/threonine-protein kinase n=1 Tax=Actinoplanes sp. NPDC049316 TaxID=3154727 RepID=UPI00343B7439